VCMCVVLMHVQPWVVLPVFVNESSSSCMGTRLRKYACILCASKLTSRSLSVASPHDLCVGVAFTSSGELKKSRMGGEWCG